jgi:inosine-uridine nucleoside N-ribohydrolase
MRASTAALFLLMAAALNLTAADPVAFDTDSGRFTDDEVALIILLRHPERVAVQCVTVVSGNVWSRQGAEYMFYTLGLLDRPDIPVHVGAEFPLLHNAAMASEFARRWGPLDYTGAFAQKFPASPGDLDPPIGGKLTGRSPAPQNAIDRLIEEVERQPGQLTILALGPMTNLAMALRLRPGIETRIKRLVFMGGNVHVPGNASKAAEFNFWFDPEAAQAVLRSRIPQKIMFGLDICNRVVVTRAMFDEIVAVKTPVTEAYREGFGIGYPGFLKDPAVRTSLWDELAAAWLIDSSLVTRSESAYLDVDTRFGPSYGAVVALDRALAPHATPVEVMLDPDLDKVFRLYKEALMRRPATP